MRRTCALLVLIVAIATGCNQMAQQPSSRANEDPQFEPPDGAVAVHEPLPLPDAVNARALESPLEATTQTIAAGRLAYRRYCWPCHGPTLNGEYAQVGPSFPTGRIDLTDPEIAKLSDGELFVFVALGTGNNPPLLGTMTDTELWETIAYLRAVWSDAVEPGPPPGKKETAE